MPRYLLRPWYAQYVLRYALKGITRTPAVAAIEDLADGERVEVPGAPCVIHVPGHTRGGCALLLEERGPVHRRRARHPRCGAWSARAAGTSGRPRALRSAVEHARRT